jgi:hypothetical protein
MYLLGNIRCATEYLDENCNPHGNSDGIILIPEKPD